MLSRPSLASCDDAHTAASTATSMNLSWLPQKLYAGACNSYTSGCMAEASACHSSIVPCHGICDGVRPLVMRLLSFMQSVGGWSRARPALCLLHCGVSNFLLQQPIIMLCSERAQHLHFDASCLRLCKQCSWHGLSAQRAALWPMNFLHFAPQLKPWPCTVVAQSAAAARQSLNARPMALITPPI